MNTEPTTAEQQRVIAQAAASYTPPEPQSHTMLMPHRESIAMLRSKGASYRTIARILDKVQIRVSLDTLSRFCRETIESKPTRKGRRASGMRPSAERTEVGSPDAPMSPASQKGAGEASGPPRGKGPRIADPDSI